jgi:hypothetical protein
MSFPCLNPPHHPTKPTPITSEEMQFPSTTTSIILTVLWCALSSNAATCDSGAIFVCVEAGGGFAATDAMLNARQNYCGGDRWQTHGCYEEPATDGGSTVLIENSKPGANDRQTCWDALESILDGELLLYRG